MDNFCDITKSIAEFPNENVQRWGITTIKDMLAYKAHVVACVGCQELMDATIEAYKDEPPSFYPISLN